MGLDLPADGPTLLAGGPEWLTRAFHATGALAPDNHVTAITETRVVEAGGTGTKLSFAVRYAEPDSDLPEALFAKFSRNFIDPAKDAARHHMAAEVRLALLSRDAAFPVAVPICMFADFHVASGTGVLITQTIAFGQGAIEPQYRKCLDQLMPEPLEHYRALIRAVAGLAGSHKAGRLPARASDEFPWDPVAALASDRLRYTPPQLANRIARYAAFAETHPQLLPAAIRSPAFIADLAEGAALFQVHETAIKTYLHAQSAFIALCHWNANADNAWFWREDEGELHCGLLDWGSVGQMHVAMTLWGCLSGAQDWLWQDHLDELLALFIAEFSDAGGPPLDHAELKAHLSLYVAMMGLCWLLDAPPRIAREVPDLAACTGPLDPRITENETARVQLQMLSNFLGLWQSEGLTEVLRDFEKG